LACAEFDADFKLVKKQEFNIPDHVMIHDWAFTETHYILFANRIKLDVIGNKMHAKSDAKKKKKKKEEEKEEEEKTSVLLLNSFAYRI
jgi:carotenoid cleavage dioxygenase-like enzyme